MILITGTNANNNKNNDWYVEDGEVEVTYDYYELDINDGMHIKKVRTSIFPCMVVDNMFSIIRYTYIYPEFKVYSVLQYAIISQDDKTIMGKFYEYQNWYDVINTIYFQIEQAKEWYPPPDNGYR